MACIDAPNRPESNEALISAALGRGPDLSLGSRDAGWQLGRWRQFAGLCRLPALPAPAFAAQVDEQSATAACTAIVPAGRRTEWLVDGERDVVALSLPCRQLSHVPARDQVRRMQAAFVDPLGVALTRQMLATLYTPASAQRDGYLGAMANALKAHVERVPPASEG